MDNNQTQFDADSTLERIRDTVESIRDKMPSVDITSSTHPTDNGLLDTLRELITSINSKLGPVVSGGTNSTDITSNTNVAGEESPLEGLSRNVDLIRNRLDVLVNQSQGNNQSKEATWLSLINRNLDAIRLHFEKPALEQPATGGEAPEETKTPTPRKQEGFLDFFKGLGTSLAKLWKGPPAPKPPTIPLPAAPTMMGMPVTNPALIPPAPPSPPAPKPPAPPSWLAGLGNTLSGLFNKATNLKPEGFGSRLSGFGGKMMDSARNQSGLGSFGDALGGVGKLAGSIPIVGKPIEGIAKLGETAFKSVDKLQEWTQNLHEANMQFAEFSGAMAGVQAEQNVRDIEYSQSRGDSRADSAGYLAEGMSDLRDAVAPIGDMVSNVKNYVGGFLSKTLGGILGGIMKLVGLGEKKEEGNPTDRPLHTDAAKEGERYWREKGNPAMFDRN